MRAVNLLPRDTRRGAGISAQQLPVLVGGGVGVIVVSVLAGGYLMAASKVAVAQHALDQAKQQLAATPAPPAPPKPVPTASAAAAQLQPRLTAVSTALSQRIAWDRILREFSLVLPDDVWLTSLSMQAPTTPAPGAAPSTTGLTLSGSTYSYESVARLLARLSLVPDLTGVTLTTTSNDGKIVQFGVTAGVKGAPAPPPAPVPAPAPATTGTTSSSSASGATS